MLSVTLTLAFDLQNPSSDHLLMLSHASWQEITSV